MVKIEALKIGDAAKKLVEYLREMKGSDHRRGCHARNAICSCGRSERVDEALGAAADLIEELVKHGSIAENERAELQQAFDMRWKADMRAIKRWQEAHPGQDLVWPDHADLMVWLLETRETAGTVQ